MTNSNQKGKRGERELAKYLRDEFGIIARRGQQFSGSPDSPDIVTNLEGLHIECKRTETLSVYKALKQAEIDCGKDMPCVMHRRSREEWLVIMKVKDIFRFYRVMKKFIRWKGLER